MLQYLADHDIALPDRVRCGPDKGEVRWNRPSQATLGDMLRHPAYAGAYVYGRRRMQRRCQLPGKPHSGRRFIRAAPHSSMVASGLGRAHRQAPQPLSGKPKAQGLTARTNPKPPWNLAECDLL